MVTTRIDHLLQPGDKILADCQFAALQKDLDLIMCPPKLSSSAIVFITPDIEKTTLYYQEVLGFRAVQHFELPEKFAALYRDGVEIVLVQSQFGTVKPNRENYGAGYDAYLVPHSLADLDAFYMEIKSRGAKIIQPPTQTTYGSREFVFADLDGRLIGVGLIKDEATFFG